MARTLSEITQAIKADFVGNPIIQGAYELDPAASFDEQFSSVSLEGAIISVIALSHYVVERLIDTFSENMEKRIEEARVCSIPWFYNKALEFQLGHSLQYNPETFNFTYPAIDEDARIVEHAAVRQVTSGGVTKLRVLTQKTGNTPLNSVEHDAFVAYMNQIGPAGIHYDFVNQNPDQLQITLQVIYNPISIDDDGRRVGGDNYPVRVAIEEYVAGLTFGGTLNKTKLVDAIQAVEGVVDVILGTINAAEDGGSFTEVTGQNAEAVSGAFIIDTITDTYTPDV